MHFPLIGELDLFANNLQSLNLTQKRRFSRQNPILSMRGGGGGVLCAFIGVVLGVLAFAYARKHSIELARKSSYYYYYYSYTTRDLDKTTGPIATKF